MSAEGCSVLAPIGRNTALLVPPKSTADRKPPANGGAGHQAWTIRILKALQFKAFKIRLKGGVILFTSDTLNGLKTARTGGAGGENDC